MREDEENGGNRLYTKTIGPSTYMLGHIRSVGRLRASFYFIFWSSSSSSVSPFPETEYQKVKCFGHVRKRRTKVYRYYYIPFTIFYFFKISSLTSFVCPRRFNIEKKKKKCGKEKCFDMTSASPHLSVMFDNFFFFFFFMRVFDSIVSLIVVVIFFFFSRLFGGFFFSFVFLIARHVAVCEDDCRLFFFFLFFPTRNFF